MIRTGETEFLVHTGYHVVSPAKGRKKSTDTSFILKPTADCLWTGKHMHISASAFASFYPQHALQNGEGEKERERERDKERETQR